MSGRIYDPFDSGGKIPFCKICGYKIDITRRDEPGKVIYNIKCGIKSCIGSLKDVIYFKTTEEQKVYLIKTRFNKSV